MRLCDAISGLDSTELAEQINTMLDRVAPLARSLTGEANRQTLELLSELLPLDTIEVPSGTAVLDWTVPDEWSVTRAHVTDPAGNTVIDVNDHPLHLLGYSVEVDRVMSRAELDAHLFSIESLPDAIPYRTSYYSPRWGFCVTQRFRDSLPEGDYHVVIDAKIAPGAMTYGTSTAPGGTEEQVLVTTHLCHPAMWNDNATGLVAVAIIGSLLHTVELRRAHTLLFLPGTIGAITWLATHRDQVANIVGGLALTGLGDTAALNFKRSRRGGSLFDRAAEVTIGRSPGAKLHEFTPYGYDERQFCSPGFNLGFGRLNRGAHGEYPEYHTSLDNRDFVDAGRVADAVRATLELLDAVERNDRFINTEPYGEPQLGRRGLYSSIGTIDAAGVEMGYLWVLSMSDGTADLIEISRRSGLAFSSIAEAAQRLLDAGLLSRVSSR